jgi:sugar lactone lactonase YvrE
MAGSIALAGVALACTAPNPAYHLDGMRGVDAGEEVDTGSSARLADAGAPDSAASDLGGSSSLPACGSARPPLDDLVAVDSLAIDGRGNIYFSNDDGTNAWIGRLPPRGAADKHWLPVPAGPPIRGLALDDAQRILYFTAGTGSAELDAASLDGAPAARLVYKGFTDPNDLAMGFDGYVYVSDQGDGQIYNVNPTSRKRTRVTTMPIGISSMGSGPAGLAFAPDHTLVVGYKGSGQLIRISLTPPRPEMPDPGPTEASRKTFGPINDWVNALAYDRRGRLYLALFDLEGPRDLVRLDSDDAKPVSVASGGQFSGMAFGRGELDCTDLYVADPAAGKVVRRLPTDAAGLLTP